MAESFEHAMRRLWPAGNQKQPGLVEGIIATAPLVFQKYGIGNSPLLIAHIMAQISHECGAGHDIVENLNYTASRMTQVWPSRFPSIASAQPYANNPRGLANKVYNGRMGNRTGSDDGWNYRGRGASQTTGKEGYERVKRATKLDVVGHPDILIHPAHFLECGVSDFINCGCLPYAKADDVLMVTKRLNGGTVGLDQRKQWLARWKAALGSEPVDLATTLPAPAPMATPAAKPATSTGGKVIAATVGAGAGSAVAASQGWSWIEIGLSGLIVAGIATAIVLLVKKFRSAS